MNNAPETTEKYLQVGVINFYDILGSFYYIYFTKIYRSLKV